MGGAAATILLPAVDEPALEAWRDLVSRRSIKIEDDDFWIPSELEARGSGGLPFYWNRAALGDEFLDLRHDELAQIRDAFGLGINGGIGLAAMCRGRPSDRILGELCLEFLADRQGLVLFDGLLVPTLELAAWRRWHAKDHVAQAADFPAAIGPHPGKIAAIDCEGEPSRHVCDARFLAFWMTHEAFHFVN